MTKQTQPHMQSIPTAAEIAAARAQIEARVDQLRAQGVEPREIEPMAFVTAQLAVAPLIAKDQATFEQYDISPAVVAAALGVSTDLQAQLKLLPADFRRARRLPTNLKTLQDDAYEELGRYFKFIDRKVRGADLQEAARKLGVGSKRGRAIKSLEANYRDVLNAAKDASLLAKFNIKPFQVAALSATHDKLLTQLPGKAQALASVATETQKVDKLQLWLELYFGDVGAVAESALADDERLEVLKELPRVEAGRATGKAAPVVAPPAQA